MAASVQGLSVPYMQGYHACQHEDNVNPYADITESRKSKEWLAGFREAQNKQAEEVYVVDESDYSQQAEADELQLAIHDRNADLVARAITSLRRPHKNGHCLWSVVGCLFGLGSTSATRLCIKHGFDPDMRVKHVLKL